MREEEYEAYEAGIYKAWAESMIGGNGALKVTYRKPRWWWTVLRFLTRGRAGKVGVLTVHIPAAKMVGWTPVAYGSAPSSTDTEPR